MLVSKDATDYIYEQLEINLASEHADDTVLVIYQYTVKS